MDGKIKTDELCFLQRITGGKREEAAMRWIRFEEEDRRSPAPDFCLPDAAGKTICKSDYRGDCSLVLAFLHSLDCEECQQAVQGFIENQASYHKEDARVLVIIPPGNGEAAERAGENPHVEQPPVTILADRDGEIRKTYAGLMVESLITAQDAALFILDSYGAPYAAYVSPELTDPGLHSEILSWLSFIGMQCPE
jgi:peroxiredoxin